MNFLDGFSENTKISNFRKFRSAGAELFHAGGWMVMMKLIVAVRNAANALKKTEMTFLKSKQKFSMRDESVMEEG